MFRHINESYIKEKWIMKLDTIRKLKMGYEMNSPIEEATYVFSRKPI
jgi:hypothetical protein